MRRVLEDLRTLREFGAVKHHPKGVRRVALSPEDTQARLWFARQCQAAGLTVTIDSIGTVLARGSAERRLLCGSHSDTQHEGGWLDGALGCVFALEAARCFRDEGLPAAIDVINFQDEEGRFGTLTGSRAFCTGHIDWEARSMLEPRVTLREAAREQWPAGDLLTLNKDDYVGFFEAHIEQGRVLDRSGRSVAAVSAIVGLRQLRITAFGEQNHAGTTKMEDRNDAARKLVRCVATIDETLASLQSAAPDLVWTFGVWDVKPGAASIVPGEASCVLQFRDPDDTVLDGVEDAVRHIASSLRVSYDRPSQKPVILDPVYVDHVRDASGHVMHSSAVHDAASLALAGVKTAMLFVPSINGISHAFDEDTSESDILAGAATYVEAAKRILTLK